MTKKQEKITGVYQIRNVVNDKKYIGSSEDVNERFSIHLNSLINDNHRYRNGKRSKLQNAWNKYGEENFVFEILSEHKLLEEARLLEQMWLDYCFIFNKKQRNSLYNTSDKAIGGNLGEEVNKKRAATLSKPEVKLKQSNSLKQMYDRPGMREKHRKATIEALAKPEIKKKQSERTKEAINKPDVRKRHLEANRRIANDPVIKQKRREISKEVANRPGMREKISKSVKKAYEDEELRKKLGKKIKIGLSKPGVKEKMSVAHIGSKSSTATTNENDVYEMRKLAKLYFESNKRNKTIILYKIIDEYAISRQVAYHILHGSKWTHVLFPIQQLDTI